jgi:AraC-like DNA-binding protein
VRAVSTRSPRSVIRRRAGEIQEGILIRYREHQPAPALRDAVQCYWTLHGAVDGAAPARNRVLPDGCMDILFDLGERGVGGERARVIGAMESAAVVWLRGSVDLLGVRFRPGGAPRFLAERASELTRRTAPLSALWGALVEGLLDRLRAAPPLQRAGLLDAMLLDRRRPDPRDEQVLAAGRIIAASGGTVAVRAVRQALGVSARQLERRFEELVGVPPRFACKVARFQQSVDLALRRPDLPLARLAAEAGYYDQPHFTREFKALAGITPAGFLAERRSVVFVQDDAGRVA